MEKIKIEITDEEHDLLLELQKHCGHRTLDETINTILKEFVRISIEKFDENDPPTGGSGVPNK